jgi:hypothetical protein
MATFTPALDERPPGPASVARFAVTRGMTVENARAWGTAARRKAADNIASTAFVRGRGGKDTLFLVRQTGDKSTCVRPLLQDYRMILLRVCPY